MSNISISAPVGLKSRRSQGKPVKNRPADVQLVHEMLIANGASGLSVSNKADAKFLEGIARYQKKKGFRQPDQVVDPKGPTFKSMIPKYMSAQAPKGDVKAGPEIKLVEIIYNGKTYHVLPKEYENVKKKILGNLKAMVMGKIRFHKSLLEAYEDVLEITGAKQGWFTAVVHALMVDESDLPKIKFATRSIEVHSKLRVAYAKGDFDGIAKWLTESDEVLYQFHNEMLRYHGELQGGAIRAMKVIKVSRAVSFAILAAVAAPVIFVAGGAGAGVGAMTMVEATAISSVGATVLMSAGEQLEKHASGQDVSFSGAVRAVAINGMISTATAGVLKNMNVKYITTISGKLAPKIAAKIPGFNKAQLEVFIQRYLNNAGQAVVKEGLEQGLKLTGEMVKSGKLPTSKQFDAAVDDAIFKGASGTILTVLADFDSKWSASHKDVLRTDVLPGAFDKVTKGVEVPQLVRTKVFNQVSTKLGEQALRLGYDAVLPQIKGNEGSKKMTTMAVKAVGTDKALRALVEREIRNSLKRQKVKLR